MYVDLGVVGVGIGWGVSKGGRLVDWGKVACMCPMVVVLWRDIVR